jgi:hypothetical protein
MEVSAEVFHIGTHILQPLQGIVIFFVNILQVVEHDRPSQDVLVKVFDHVTFD